VVLTDPLPAGVTYVAGSLQISMGPNMGAKTDDAGDDQAEYDMGTNTVVFRIGTGADEINGGVIPIGESTEVKFQVTVDPDTMGEIQNQGIINAAGEMGAPPADTPTDGNGGDQGSPPTGSVVDLCSEDADCSDPTPICNTDLDPNQCVGCVDDDDCGPLTPTCEQEGFSCVCIASGDEVCDGVDNDCNGEADEGFNVGDACSAGEGECAADGQIACNDDGEAACDATPGEPGVEVCDEQDNDCDGEIDNACVACVEDSDCGADDSGMVCDDGGMCIDGCRGTGGNGCPDGQECTSQDDSIGMCVPAGDTDSGASNSDSDSTPTESNSNSDSTPTESNSDADSESESNSDADSNSDSNSGGIDDEGFGCECGAQGGAGGGWLLLGLAGLTLGTRRRRRAA
jgi:MYXO-CTERM domain-containing protein